MKNRNEVEVGDIIYINYMQGEPQYSNCEGIVKAIDDIGQIHGTWGGLALNNEDDWRIIGKSNSEVLDFIKRRFPTDCDWLNGNCYYFAIILKDRFPEGKLLYDVIDGHFVVKIDEIYYDWSGVVPSRGSHVYKDWDSFDNYDSLEKERVIKDCIL